MQYILTEQEYNDLHSSIKVAENNNTSKIQALCSMVADHKPVDTWKDGPTGPWGCILTPTPINQLEEGDDGSEIGNGCGYCDYCPVQDQCPNPYKGWSK